MKQKDTLQSSYGFQAYVSPDSSAMWGSLIVAIIADTWILGNCCPETRESALCNKPLLSSERIFSEMREAMMDMVLLQCETGGINPLKDVCLQYK